MRCGLNAEVKMKKDHEYKVVRVIDLIPYINNSRTHSDEQVSQVAASIKEFGFANPVLIDEQHGVIAGHGRIMAAKKLGLAEIPCVQLVGLTEAQKKAYVIADNQIALNAGWDIDMLRREVESLMEMEFDTGILGFEDEFLSELLDVRDDDEVYNTDEDAVPAEQETHVSTIGDVWAMGDHRLMCGDSTNTSDVAKLMDGDLADLVWTDPPYNVAVEGKAGKILNDDMGRKEFRAFLRSVYDRYVESMREGAVIYVAHAEKERAAFSDCMEDAGLKISQNLIWVKNSAVLSRQDFNWQHEPILFGWKEGKGHYFCEDFTLTTVIDDDIDIDKMKKEDLVALLKQIQEQVPTSVIRHDRPTKSDMHPTMKPVGLVQRMVEWSSKPGWIVLDLFGGSGSTMIACQKSNRRARMMELDPKFSDVIINRWQDFTGREAVHIESGKTYAQLKRERLD